MSFSARFSEARKAARLTQRAIADAVGVTVQAVSQWEKGRAEVSRDRVAVLSKLLGVEESWLLGSQETRLVKKPMGFPARLLEIPHFGNRTVNVFSLDTFAQMYRKLGTEIDQSGVLKVIFIDDETVASKLIFGIKIESDELSPELRKGDIAIFDANVSADVGDIATVLIAKTGFVQTSGDNSSLSSGVAAIVKRGAEGEILKRGIFSIPKGIDVKDLESAAIFVLATMIERRSFTRRG